EALRLVARGQDDLSPDGENGPAIEAVTKRMLDADRKVARAARRADRIAKIRAYQRQRDLDLAARTEALFPQELVLEHVAAFPHDRRRDHGLVLGVRLLGEQRARHVELAARPARIAAHRSDVI